SQGIYSQAGNVVTFTLASINANNTATLTIVATATGSGNMTNQTQVISSTADPNMANNLVQTATRVNARPVITPNPIPTQRFNEDTTLSLPFTVSDVETAAGSLQVVVGSSNPSIIPNSGLSVTGAGGSKTLAVTPVL